MSYLQLQRIGEHAKCLYVRESWKKILFKNIIEMIEDEYRLQVTQLLYYKL